MAKYIVNQKKNGVELYFNKAPSEAIRKSLKVHGWKWSRFGRFWYNKLSAENINTAKAFQF